MLRRLNRGYDGIEIVTGSTDSGRRAISTSKPAADIVEPSSIPPLLDPTDSANKVASVNADLLHTTLPGKQSCVRRQHLDVYPRGRFHKWCLPRASWLPYHPDCHKQTHQEIGDTIQGRYSQSLRRDSAASPWNRRTTSGHTDTA